MCIRDRYGRFLVEGPQAVREAVRHAPDDVQDLYLSLASADRYPEIVGDAAVRGVPLQLGTPEVLEAMSPDAQGVVAVVRIRPASLASALAGLSLIHISEPTR